MNSEETALVIVVVWSNSTRSFFVSTRNGKTGFYGAFALVLVLFSSAAAGGALWNINPSWMACDHFTINWTKHASDARWLLMPLILSFSLHKSERIDPGSGYSYWYSNNRHILDSHSILFNSTTFQVHLGKCPCWKAFVWCTSSLIFMCIIHLLYCSTNYQYWLWPGYVLIINENKREQKN